MIFPQFQMGKGYFILNIDKAMQMALLNGQNVFNRAVPWKV